MCNLPGKFSSFWNFCLDYVLVSNAKFSYLWPFSLIRITQIPNIHALFLGSWKLACAVVNMCKWRHFDINRRILNQLADWYFPVCYFQICDFMEMIFISLWKMSRKITLNIKYVIPFLFQVYFGYYWMKKLFFNPSWIFCLDFSSNVLLLCNSVLFNFRWPKLFL